MRIPSITVLSISALLASSAPRVTQASPKTNAHPDDVQIFAILDAASAGEIAAANLALTRSGNADVKSFAGDMIKAHTQLQTDGTALATRLGLTPVEGATSRSLVSGAAKELKKLGRLQRAEFDEAYVDSQVADHKKVLRLVDKTLLPNAINDAVKTMLQSARSVVSEHLQHARHLQALLRGASSRVTAGENP